ncbi:MAG TPA: hypothetical protein VGF17_17010 [Phytomonospora sp.]|nr:hypothetical protein [Streptomycetaceae bacterium]
MSLPIVSVTEYFDGWKTDVTVKRSGGRDAKGNPTPATDHTEQDVLVVPSESVEPVQARSEDPTTSAVAYMRVGADVKSTDRIVVPVSHWMAGTYEVIGDPGPYPLGTVVALRRA